jgi:hypothetical protein
VTDAGLSNSLVFAPFAGAVLSNTVREEDPRRCRVQVVYFRNQ